MPTEIWKAITIPDFKGKYIVSESGRVKRKGYFTKTTGKWKPDKMMTLQVHKGKGYLRINLSKNGKTRSFYAHRLVGMYFVPNPENKPCINHKDGNKTNNHYSNLEWCTDAENNQHARELGLFEGSNSKIPKEQRKFIKENFFTIGRAKLAEMFGLTEEYVLSVAKVKVNGTPHRKKTTPRYKKIIDTETGQIYNSEEVAAILGIKRKYVHRMLNEERKPNTSKFKYAS